MGPIVLPALTSLECARALQRVGFELEEVNERRISLRRKDGRRVFVPRHAILLPPQLRAILHVAGVTEAELTRVLPPGSSGTFVRPSVDAPAPALTSSSKKRT